MTNEESNRIRRMADDIQQAAVHHYVAEKRLRDLVAEFNDYVRAVERNTPKEDWGKDLTPAQVAALKKEESDA